MKFYITLFLILLCNFVWATDKFTDILKHSQILFNHINICDENNPCKYFYYTETGLFSKGHTIYMESCEATLRKYTTDHKIYTVVECKVNSNDEKYGFSRLGIISRTGDEIIDKYSYNIKLSGTKMYNVDGNKRIENNQIADIADKDSIKLSGGQGCPSKIWSLIIEDGYIYELQFDLFDMFFYEGSKLVNWNIGY